MELSIKHISESDAPILRKMAQACPPLDIHTPYTYWVVSKLFCKYSFLAYDNGAPIGYIMCVKNDDCLLIWQIGVLEEYRGKKVSSSLIDAVFDVVRSEIIPAVIVSIAPDNKESFFAFKSYSDRHGYQLGKIDVLMLTDLNDGNFSENEVLYEIRSNNNLYSFNTRSEANY